MKVTKFRAWIRNYDWDGTNMTPAYRMYPWDGFFFSDESPVTGYSGEFPTDGTDVTLMQYVGEQDMDGVDIYEGDIIYKETCAPDDPAYGSYGAVGVIKEDPDGMGWIIDDLDEDSKAFYDNMGANFSFNEIKVIGNVYENRDLIG